MQQRRANQADYTAASSGHEAFPDQAVSDITIHGPPRGVVREERHKMRACHPPVKIRYKRELIFIEAQRRREVHLYEQLVQLD